MFGEIMREITSFESIDELLTDGGWEFDVDNSTDDLATWFYPPSGIDTEDETVETVTRIWVGADSEDVDDSDLEWHVIFVGAGDGAIDYIFSAESLVENLLTIEAYRLGDAEPDFQG
ncbi:hypothetical protein [Mycolicibacterium baixiangningiae]|nr:hypothetical protein [Mycolicibacterium baixiangningiae]